jgi:hypothetical protein
MTTATSGVVFYDEPGAIDHPPRGEHWKYLHYGRCKSGRQWFWCAQSFSYDDDELHELHGYAVSEEAAITAARAACTELAAGQPAGASFRASTASGALKRVNAAKRRARPASGDRDAKPVEYLYVPWTEIGDFAARTTGINAIPIVKKTAKRIYYDASDSWDKYDQVHTLSWIDREELETDTRCADECVRTVPAGPVCAAHSLGYLHCVHAGQGFRRGSGCWREGGCAETCPLGVPAGVQCAQHGHTRPHCRHDRALGECPHGSPAGQAGKRRDSIYHGRDFYATREAAQAELDAGYEKHEPADLRELRMAMADAHPDRGGTAEEFMAARQRYKRAEARAGK